MKDYLKAVRDAIEQQRIRFRKGLGADCSFLVLILILIFVNIYTHIKDTGNPTCDFILIFVALWFFLGWNIYVIVKNSLGLWGLQKTEDMIGDIRSIKSEAMDVPTSTFFSGFFYDVIDKNFSEYVYPLGFHLKKKKENLLSLNIRYVWWEILILSTGIAMFVSQCIYFGYADFSHWETIFGLVIMLVSFAIAFGWQIPRQVIVNRQIKLNDMNKLTDSEYYDRYKFFYVEKVLAKFWNHKIEK